MVFNVYICIIYKNILMFIFCISGFPTQCSFLIWDHVTHKGSEVLWSKPSFSRGTSTVSKITNFSYNHSKSQLGWTKIRPLLLITTEHREKKKKEFCPNHKNDQAFPFHHVTYWCFFINYSFRPAVFLHHLHKTLFRCPMVELPLLSHST